MHNNIFFKHVPCALMDNLYLYSLRQWTMHPSQNDIAIISGTTVWKFGPTAWNCMQISTAHDTNKVTLSWTFC